MPFPLITPELIARIEQFHFQFNAARMEALQKLPGNPYQVEIETFGGARAFKTRSPLLRGKNRIGNFRPDDIPFLADALRFYRRDGLRCTLTVPHGQMTQDLFFRLSEETLWSGGSGMVPALVPDITPPHNTRQSGIDLQIREADTSEADKTLYLDLFQQAFGARQESQADYLLFQWAEDTQPGCRRYLAFLDNIPVAMASFPLIDGVGMFGTAGVLPAWRGRGIQSALIERRIADAPTFGCNLIIGGGGLFSTTHRNFERAGLRLIPLGFGWTDAAP